MLIIFQKQHLLKQVINFIPQQFAKDWNVFNKVCYDSTLFGCCMMLNNCLAVFLFFPLFFSSKKYVVWKLYWVASQCVTSTVVYGLKDTVFVILKMSVKRKQRREF